MAVRFTKAALTRAFQEAEAQSLEMQRGSPYHCPIARAIEVQGGRNATVGSTAVNYQTAGGHQVLRQLEPELREFIHQVDRLSSAKFTITAAEARGILEEVYRAVD